ncbi:MAG TPA: VOC family protein [Candidatus Binataceae bacterium]|nr:VOC family protein [Candidatus Binataceae bacterium]
MELNRPQIDVGIFTNNIDAMKAFYGDNLGLPFESVLPVGGGFKQHRYVANGSILKLMESKDPLPRRHPGGYETLMIATSKVSQPEAINDPDGNTIELVPPGRDDVNQIEVRLGVSDPDAFDGFYTKASAGKAMDHHRVRIGETIFATFRHPLLRPAKPAPFANALDVVKAMASLGIRYVTLQVKNCDAAFKEMTDAGATVALKPENFGNVARIAFVRDPDGNFIELAQRPPS